MSKLIIYLLAGILSVGSFFVAPGAQAEDLTQPDQVSAPSTEAYQQQAIGSLTAEESQMVNLVNAERAKMGLKPLAVDFRLVGTARAKSQDMVTYNYFSHNSPRLGSPFEQMRKAGITYRYAGENIAAGPSVARMHQALMNSPGHRANILNARFTKIGIGIIRGGRYGYMITQQFIG